MPAVICKLRDAAARQVLRGLKLAGVEVVTQARSAHGSDCNCNAGHLSGPMGRCRCLRVMRLRSAGGDWMLIFGDCQEGPTVRLQGPYTEGTPLHYGGGFWINVEV